MHGTTTFDIYADDRIDRLEYVSFATAKCVNDAHLWGQKTMYVDRVIDIATPFVSYHNMDLSRGPLTQLICFANQGIEAILEGGDSIEECVRRMLN